MRVQQIQKQNADALAKKNKDLEKRWAAIKSRSVHSGTGQSVFYETMLARQDVNNRRQWVQ